MTSWRLRMVGDGLRCIAAAGLVLCALALPALALTFPQLSGRVVDEAHILDADTRVALDRKLADLETKSTIQFVVVTLPSLQGTSIEDYGYQLGRHWQIGQKDKNNGVLLIVAPNDRKVRIEVGYGLEGTLTDAITSLIIRGGILPRFRANDMQGGVTRGVDDVISVLSGDAEEWKRAAARSDTTPQSTDVVSIIILIIVIIFLIYAMRGNRLNRRRMGPWIVTTGSSGWGGGFSGGGGSSGGGGFSGGGGSFGGGGSSGSW